MLAPWPAQTFNAPSPQQLAVLLGLWDGLTVKGIARRVGLSPKTVKNYLQHLYVRLEAPGQVALVRRCLELGILQVPEHARPRGWDVEVPG